MYAKLGSAGKDFWDHPNEDGKITQYSTSACHLSGKSK
jgi:hypothetical protein